MAEKTTKKINKNELLSLAFVFLVVFIAAFSVMAWFNSQNTQLYGFKVTAGQQPLKAIKSVLEQNRSLVLRQELVNGTSRVNTAIAAASAELVFAVYSTGVTVHNYALVDGVVFNETCNANNSFCGPPDVTLAASEECNCITVYSNRTMLITGGSQFLLENAQDLRKIVQAARAYNESQ